MPTRTLLHCLHLKRHNMIEIILLFYHSHKLRFASRCVGNCGDTVLGLTAVTTLQRHIPSDQEVGSSCSLPDRRTCQTPCLGALGIGRSNSSCGYPQTVRCCCMCMTLPSPHTPLSSFERQHRTLCTPCPNIWHRSKPSLWTSILGISISLPLKGDHTHRCTQKTIQTHRSTLYLGDSLISRLHIYRIILKTQIRTDVMNAFILNIQISEERGCHLSSPCQIR